MKCPYSPTANIGVFVRNDFLNHHLGIKTGIAYHRLFHTGDYTYRNTIGVWLPTDLNPREYNEVYGVGYNYLTVPLLFYFSRFQIQPFVGINYNLLVSDCIDKEAKNYVGSNNVGLNAGLEWRISKSFAVNAMYMYNFTPDITHVKTTSNPIIYGGKFKVIEKMHHQQVTLSLVYRFR